MDAVLRAVAVYAVVMILFRVSGKRTLSEMTTFDFVLLIIIGEATQQALLGDDFSVSNALIIIATLLGADILLSEIKHRFPRLGKILDNTPIVVFADGKLLKNRTDKERVDEEDILHAARTQHGLERLDQVKYAVLELSGGISIIPKESAK